jgi:glycosyltransferase involved in cell wall biosynthesis
MARRSAVATFPRIAINASSIAGPRTGIGRATAELCRALLAQWPADWPAPTLWINTGRAGRLPQDAWLRDHADCVHAARWPGKLLLRGWQHLGWPRFESLAGPADVVHAPDSYVPAVRAARRVVTVHDLYFRHAPEHVDAYGGGYFAQTFARALPQCAAISTVSAFTRDELLHFYPQLDPARIHVVPHGVDHALYQPQAVADDVAIREGLGLRGEYLLCVATLEPRKNLERLVQAYARAQALAAPRSLALPPLAIAGGRGWGMRTLEQMTEASGVRGHVLALGYVAETNLPALYRGALGLVFPSLHEGFGLPALEAMACGCPTLLARAGSLPEVGGEAAAYLDPRNVDAMADALITFCTNAARLDSLRAAGIERARGFTWEAAARATLPIYRRVLGPGEARQLPFA